MRLLHGPNISVSRRQGTHDPNTTMRTAPALPLVVLLQCTSALRVTRRSLPGAAAAATALSSKHALAAAKPVLVLGANGGTGLECVKYLQKKGRPCVAATRTGEFVGEASRLVTVAKGTPGVEKVPSRHRRGNGGAAHGPAPAQATSRASRAWKD